MAQSSRRDDADASPEPSDRPGSTDELWSDVRIDPVEIALPAGVGITLRAYRPAEPGGATAEPDEDAELDDFDAAAAAVAASRASLRSDRDGGRNRLAAGDEPDESPELSDLDELADLEEIDDAELGLDEEEQGAEPALEEDVPVFLGRRGRLYLFRSPDRLIDFIRSGAEHDIAGLDTWTDLADRVTTGDLVPLAEDHYELDLIVANLRGGPDVWDPTLIVRCGELARDLGYALRIEPVLTALAPGSPLDDLDEVLRAVSGGGLGAFLARRRLRRIPAQQSALAWRTIIGKISAAVDWRD